MEKGGVEISGVPLLAGLRVDVAVHIDMREDATFHRTTAGGVNYLIAREEIYATPDNLQDAVKKVADIGERGRGLIYFKYQQS